MLTHTGNSWFVRTLMMVLVLTPVMVLAQVAPPQPEANPRPAAREIDPGQYYYDLAQVHARYGKVEEAKAAYAQALGASKTDQMKAGILSSWGEFLIRNDEVAAGREKLEQSMTHITDKNIKSRMALGLARAFEKEGKPEEAAAQYKMALEISDQPRLRESVINQMLMAHRMADDFDAFTAQYEAAVKENPKDTTALEVLVAIYSRMKPNTEKAIQACSQLAALQPEDPEIQLQLADLYIRAGQTEQATPIYQNLSEHAVSERIRNRAKRGLLKLDVQKESK